MTDNLYVHYGCGLTAPDGWINFDSSPTLKIQRTWIIGPLLKSRLNCVFPSNVKVGNIVTGLPVPNNSSAGVYCSHVLEHLSLEDFRTALKNTYKILRPGGIFRCVVPDLEPLSRAYLHDLSSGRKDANTQFLQASLLGQERRPKGIQGVLTVLLGASHHLWMWDFPSLSDELANAGFSNIRRASYHDCEDKHFQLVEDPNRFQHAVAVECRK